MDCSLLWLGVWLNLVALGFSRIDVRVSGSLSSLLLGRELHRLHTPRLLYPFPGHLAISRFLLRPSPSEPLCGHLLSCYLEQSCTTGSQGGRVCMPIRTHTRLSPCSHPRPRAGPHQPQPRAACDIFGDGLCPWGKSPDSAAPQGLPISLTVTLAFSHCRSSHCSQPEGSRFPEGTNCPFCLEHTSLHCPPGDSLLVLSHLTGASRRPADVPQALASVFGSHSPASWTPPLLGLCRVVGRPYGRGTEGGFFSRLAHRRPR